MPGILDRAGSGRGPGGRRAARSRRSRLQLAARPALSGNACPSAWANGPASSDDRRRQNSAPLTIFSQDRTPHDIAPRPPPQAGPPARGRPASRTPRQGTQTPSRTRTMTARELSCRQPTIADRDLVRAPRWLGACREEEAPAPLVLTFWSSWSRSHRPPYIMQGAIHLVLFAAFLMSVCPEAVHRPSGRPGLGFDCRRVPRSRTRHGVPLFLGHVPDARPDVARRMATKWRSVNRCRSRLFGWRRAPLEPLGRLGELAARYSTHALVK